MINNVSVELKLLLCTISDVLNALKSLGLPMDEWDSLVLQIILERLTPELSEAWECKGLYRYFNNNPSTSHSIGYLIRGVINQQPSEEVVTSWLLRRSPRPLKRWHCEHCARRNASVNLMAEEMYN
ncbi:hypothetical protein PV326_006867 [Microctonus aethiopoides]|uniref:Uncharacterized protein n=1 Tax=Microctonus aethiopoides TaxID=144406 RepID=A0AA39FW18_9HYME|nr:hypothetical protein PV326_006867 [Microctonus aethiopoides]KAK0176912.1 hypothetical protein PV328_001010 [Microctonus aethiopoides]